MRVLIHQGGPMDAASGPAPLERVEEELQRGSADLVLLSELALSPYYAVSTTPVPTGPVRIDGPEVAAAIGIAKRHSTLIALPFAEREDGPAGVAYNSIVLVGPDGPLEGLVVTGPETGSLVPTYRKVHLSENRSGAVGVHEKYHFRAGAGFVVWETPIGRIAPLICYDRSFPESWRAVADAGAAIVLVPMATSRPERVRMLEAELSVAAVQNGVFALAACKGGTERFDGAEVTYSGGSMVVGPDGTIRARAEAAIGDVFLRAELDPADLAAYGGTFHYRRDRRPDAYGRPNPAR